MSVIRIVQLLCALVAASANVPSVSAAEPPDPARTYRVIGVEPSDSLTIRQQPDHRSEALGRFPADAEGIVVTGVRVEVQEPGWWEVVRPGGGTGWVNARYLAAGPEVWPRPTDWPLVCVGTEPFWSVRVENGEAEFNDASMGTVTRYSAGPAIGVAGRADYVIFQLEGSGGGTGFVAGIPEYEGCSDGMSDRTFPLTGLVLRPDGGAFEGCCARAG